MTSISLLPINPDTSSPPIGFTPNLPRFNKEFIGIGHQLQEKKKQRRRIEQQQRAMANRVIFLQKQQLRAQQNLKRKKSQLSKMMQTLERTNHQKLEKQHIRRIKQLELQALVEQNRNRRLTHKQAKQSARYSLETEKHNTYSRIRSFIKEKEQQKQDFIFDDIKQKKDKWLSLNIDKEKGKQKIDFFYKKKNAQHTLNYMQMIQQQENTRLQKINTIKHLEVFETVLKKKLQESTSRVSQVQEKILKSSRTIDQKRSVSQQKSNEFFLGAKPTRRLNSNLASYTIEPMNPEYTNDLNISFERETSLSEKGGSLTERETKSPKQNQDEIQEKIEYPNVQDIEMSTFKIIRTVKKRKKSNKYKPYQLL